MHVRVERRFQVRVAENCLGVFHRLAHFTQQRRIDMPEGMPRNPRKPQAVARWCEHAVVEILRAEWRSPRCSENGTVRFGRSAVEFVYCKCVLQRSAHWNHPPTASCLGRSELSIGECFCNFDGRSQKIEPLPTKRKNLSDAHTREHGSEYNCATWFSEVLKESLNLRGR